MELSNLPPSTTLHNTSRWLSTTSHDRSLCAPLALSLDLDTGLKWQSLHLSLRHLAVHLEWFVGRDGALAKNPAAGGAPTWLGTLALLVLGSDSAGKMAELLTMPCCLPSLFILLLRGGGRRSGFVGFQLLKRLAFHVRFFVGFCWWSLIGSSFRRLVDWRSWQETFLECSQC